MTEPFVPDDKFMRDFFRMPPRNQRSAEDYYRRNDGRLYLAIQIYKLCDAMRTYSNLLS
jgi:hypothetical protein